MFEKFTDRARKVLALANQEAQRHNHEYIGTEHILLGLIKEGTGVGGTVLVNLGVNLLAARQELLKRVKTGPDIVTRGKLPKTPMCKKVIEYAIEEARNLNHNYIGTEHLLLGLLRRQKRDGEYTPTIAQSILKSLGVSPKSIREEVLQALGVTKIKEVERSLNCKLFECRPDTKIGEMQKKISKFLKQNEQDRKIVLVAVIYY